MYDAPSVPLTPGETALVQAVFGKAIDTSIVQKHFFSAGCNGRGSQSARTYDGENISFCQKKYHEADYSKTKDAFNFGLFMHEMTHIWQNQDHPVRHRLSWLFDSKEYGYDLSPDSRFEDFSIEQQAAIIEDYARRFLQIKPAKSDKYIHDDTSLSDTLLQRVVEGQFSVARDARIAMARQRVQVVREARLMQKQGSSLALGGH